jgi:uncharacterized RDD family membrane protein YckC
MRTINIRTLACAALLALGATASAQDRPRPAPRPEALPPLESPAVRTPTQQRPPASAAPEQVERDRIEELRDVFPKLIVRIAQDYTLPAGERIREIRSVFGDVTIAGRVDSDVVVVMGSARLESTAAIDGSLVVVGGSATVDQGAAIQRDMVVVGGTLSAPAGFSPVYGEHVVVGTPWMGHTLSAVVPWVTQGLLWGRLIVPALEWIWLIVAVFFVVYLALNALFDRPVGASADVLVSKPVSTFMVGLLVLVLSVPAIVILAASVIGIAIVPFLICALIVAGLVGKVGVARAMGRSILRPELPEGRMAALGTFVIGFGLLTLAYMVPVLGFVTWALTSVLGLGAATVTFRSLMRRERPAPAPVPAAAPPVVQPPVAEPSAMAVGAPEPTAGGTPFEAARPIVPPLPPPRADVPPPPSAFTLGMAQYPRATFLDRAAAFGIDCVLVAVANSLLDWNRNDGSWLFFLLLYYIAFWAWKGTSLGGIIVGLKVTRTDGRELTFADALVRGLSGVLSLAALGIGCFWMLQDPERQTWHDKIAGTLVVKAPREVVLPA